MIEVTTALAAAISTATTRRIDGAAHAVLFDATASYVQLIGEWLTA